MKRKKHDYPDVEKALSRIEYSKKSYKYIGCLLSTMVSEELEKMGYQIYYNSGIRSGCYAVIKTKRSFWDNGHIFFDSDFTNNDKNIHYYDLEK